MAPDLMGHVFTTGRKVVVVSCPVSSMYFTGLRGGLTKKDNSTQM
jgi:hypothetical protein